MQRVGDLVSRMAEIEARARQRKAEREKEQAKESKPTAPEPAKAVKPQRRRKKAPETGCFDIATKDNRSIMDVAVFRLSKKDKRAGQVIQYTLPNGYIKVKAGPDGMASIWDYDIVLMAISQLTEAMNKYRKREGEKPGRVFRPHVSEILRFCRRPEGGKQREALVGALARLSNTNIQMEREQIAPNGKKLVISEGASLIDSYRLVGYRESGKLTYIQIELPGWLYEAVVESENPDVLTVHPDFFLIDQGVSRFLYRLARKAAGKGDAKWLFRTIYDRSGSAGTFREFCRLLRKIIEANDLPEYELTEEGGKSGPTLIMKLRCV